MGSSALVLLTTAVSVGALGFALRNATRPTQLRPGIEWLRVAVGIASILVMAGVVGTSTEPLLGIAAGVVGAVLGFVQGAQIEIIAHEGVLYARRTRWGIALWGAGLVLMQIAGLGTRVDVFEVGQAVAIFSVAVMIGVIIGRGGEAPLSPQVGHAVASVALLLLTTAAVGVALSANAEPADALAQLDGAIAQLDLSELTCETDEFGNALTPAQQEACRNGGNPPAPPPPPPPTLPPVPTATPIPLPTATPMPLPTATSMPLPTATPNQESVAEPTPTVAPDELETAPTPTAETTLPVDGETDSVPDSTGASTSPAPGSTSGDGGDTADAATAPLPDGEELTEEEAVAVGLAAALASLLASGLTLAQAGDALEASFGAAGRQFAQAHGAPPSGGGGTSPGGPPAGPAPGSPGSPSPGSPAPGSPAPGGTQSGGSQSGVPGWGAGGSSPTWFRPETGGVGAGSSGTGSGGQTPDWVPTGSGDATPTSVPSGSGASGGGATPDWVPTESGPGSSVPGQPAGSNAPGPGSNEAGNDRVRPTWWPTDAGSNAPGDAGSAPGGSSSAPGDAGSAPGGAADTAPLSHGPTSPLPGPGSPTNFVSPAASTGPPSTPPRVSATGLDPDIELEDADGNTLNQYPDGSVVGRDPAGNETSREGPMPPGTGELTDADGQIVRPSGPDDRLAVGVEDANGNVHTTGTNHAGHSFERTEYPAAAGSETRSTEVIDHGGGHTTDRVTRADGIVNETVTRAPNDYTVRRTDGARSDTFTQSGDRTTSISDDGAGRVVTTETVDVTENRTVVVDGEVVEARLTSSEDGHVYSSRQTAPGVTEERWGEGNSQTVRRTTETAGTIVVEDVSAAGTSTTITNKVTGESTTTHSY